MHPRFVITSLIGGLGNQMFQYAAGRALADRHNAKLLLDISGFENYQLRRYELEDLNIRAEIATQDELAAFKPSHHIRNGRPGRILRRLVTIFNPFKTVRTYQEPSFAYAPKLNELTPPVHLTGYWQSERYFLKQAEIIRHDFSLKSPLNAECQKIIHQIHQTPSVSLHVRRGDYVSDTTTAQFHGTCSLDYYREAVKYIAERVSHPHFFIFSDDLDWVSKNLHLNYHTTLVDVNGPDRGVADMAMMKECQHHIIANSSFSWWGAWLNPSSEKIVIAPQHWFNQATHDTSDLIPTTWIQL